MPGEGTFPFFLATSFFLVGDDKYDDNGQSGLVGHGRLDWAPALVNGLGKSQMSTSPNGVAVHDAAGVVMA